ncbi:hypothetical protein GGI11_002804, partial [Coemansia sp. RSA 2049]
KHLAFCQICWAGAVLVLVLVLALVAPRAEGAGGSYRAGADGGAGSPGSTDKAGT